MAPFSCLLLLPGLVGSLTASRPGLARSAIVATRSQLSDLSEVAVAQKPISPDWELDCFSRPVIVDGKKLWELLITDASGQWRDVSMLPANGVNSVAVRAAIEEVISRAPVKPRTIRFFRKQMYNMLKIALDGVASTRPSLRIRPSRATHALYNWLEERHVDVYPAMAGYDTSKSSKSFTLKPIATKLPEMMRGEQFAFVSLPLAELLAGGSIDPSNIGVGQLIALPAAAANAPDDAMIPGRLPFGVVLGLPPSKSTTTAPVAQASQC